MPLSSFQKQIAKLLSVNRHPNSYLAGASALNFKPNTLRFSQDLDYFHDTLEQVSTSYTKDAQRLKYHGYNINLEISQPGYIRSIVSKNNEATKIEWAHDSAFRFMPVMKDPECGYVLHPVDLALNKLLALAGRDEPRDVLDVLYSHEHILSLGALCFAACAKDPGFTPHSLLELLKRRSKLRQEDIDRLHLARPISLVDIKQQWQIALSQAQEFFDTRPIEEVGCIYYDLKNKTFYSPEPFDKNHVLHFGQLGGVLPRVIEN